MADTILLLAVALLSTSQVLQKIGAQRRLVNAKNARHWIVALFSPELIGAGIAIVAGTALWLYVLYQMDVSRAFPFLSLGSVVVVAVSRFLLGERVSAYRWAGVVLITIGIALVART
jgi:drug/metabolite transporter (DMT)-like permease